MDTGRFFLLRWFLPNLVLSGISCNLLSRCELYPNRLSFCEISKNVLEDSTCNNKKNIFCSKKEGENNCLHSVIEIIMGLYSFFLSFH